MLLLTVLLITLSKILTMILFWF